MSAAPPTRRTGVVMDVLVKGNAPGFERVRNVDSGARESVRENGSREHADLRPSV
jgi:hypothetical protein